MNFHSYLYPNLPLTTKNRVWYIQLLKKVALPEEYAHAHPKRLRFSVFTVIGRVVNHTGRLLLRVAAGIFKRDSSAPARRKVLQDGIRAEVAVSKKPAF